MSKYLGIPRTPRIVPGWPVVSRPMSKYSGIPRIPRIVPGWPVVSRPHVQVSWDSQDTQDCPGMASSQ